MIKRTLFFENPAYLSLKDRQMVVKRPKQELTTVPIEDIGMVVLDNRQITFSQALMSELLANNAAVICCDQRHLPSGLLLPLDGHTVQSERFRFQLEASVPLKKQLWQQTIQCKIVNQAKVLNIIRGIAAENMYAWAGKVKSGDSENKEAVAAAYYWKEMFPDVDGFTRDRFGVPPNNMLNYGYAILRGVVARGLVGSGLFPVFGIHHHNRYNAYCLADDIMEPYRPLVDMLVFNLFKEYGCEPELGRDVKKVLLSIPVIDVIIDGKRSPLMNAVSITTASLCKCFSGELRKVVYPEVPDGENQ